MQRHSRADEGLLDGRTGPHRGSTGPLAVQGAAYGSHLRLQRCIGYILQHDTFDPDSAPIINVGGEVWLARTDNQFLVL